MFDTFHEKLLKIINKNTPFKTLSKKEKTERNAMDNKKYIYCKKLELRIIFTIST